MHSLCMFMRSACRDVGLDLRFRFCVHMCTGSKLEWFFIFMSRVLQGETSVCVAVMDWG